MNPNFAVLLAAAFAAAAQAQTPDPAPAPAPAAATPAAESPKPRPPLKLQLDEKDMRALMPLTPRDGEKKDDAGLPTLGGNAAPDPRKPADVVPKDLTPGH